MPNCRFHKRKFDLTYLRGFSKSHHYSLLVGIYRRRLVYYNSKTQEMMYPDVFRKMVKSSGYKMKEVFPNAKLQI